MATVGTLGRRILALVLGWVCVALILAGGILHTTESLVGTPQAFANTAVATVTEPSVEQAVSVSAVNEISASSTPAVARILAAHATAFQGAIVLTLNEPRIQAEARTLLAQMYQLADSDSPASVNLRPLIVDFTSSLHSRDRAVPAVPPGLEPRVEVQASGLKKLGSLSTSLNGFATWGFAVGLLGAFLIARFLIRGHRKQLWSVGTLIGEPAIGLLFIGVLGHHAGSVVHLGSSTGRLIVTSLLARISNSLEHTALLLLLLDAVVVLAWQTASVIHRRFATSQGRA